MKYLHKSTEGNTYLQNKKMHNIKPTKIERIITDYLDIVDDLNTKPSAISIFEMVTK